MFFESVDKIDNSVRKEWERLLGQPLTDICEIKSGRNSRVCRLICADNQIYAGKWYFRDSMDLRNRMQAEVAALELCNEYNINCVPKLLAKDFNLGFIVLEFINGREVLPITTDDIEKAVHFLLSLRDVAREKDPEGICPASEACFSASALVENIQMRLGRFIMVPDGSPFKRELEIFLQNDFMPTLDTYIHNARRILKQYGVPFDVEISNQEKTLSPSDFGFHNAIRGEKGLYFVDFEYFGWDDPAKTICDFVLHPAMDIADKHTRHFVNLMLNGMDKTGYLRCRAEAYFPLLGLKWCLIFLNEFIPSDLARRRFAKSLEIDIRDVLGVQLNKAKEILKDLRVSYSKFIDFCDV